MPHSTMFIKRHPPAVSSESLLKPYELHHEPISHIDIDIMVYRTPWPLTIA